MGKHDSDSDSDDSRSGDEDEHRKLKKDKKGKKDDKKDKKDKKEKKDKEKKDKHSKHRGSDDEHFFDTQSGPSATLTAPPPYPLAPSAFPAPTPQLHQQFNASVDSKMHSHDSLLVQAPGGRISPRPPSRLGRPPPSGYRVPLTAEAPFPSPQQTGPPPTYDADGTSPVYFGSALFPNSVHPCKVAPHLPVPCSVPYGGSEWPHSGRYDLLPWNPETMELVPTSYGVIPHGRRPVEGGYEEGGQKLYHAMGVVQGVRVPGKTGEHLGAANIPFGNAENVVTEYEILCWRD